MFGDGMYARALHLISELAPVSRRDSWWSTDGPMELIAEALNKAKLNK